MGVGVGSGGVEQTSPGQVRGSSGRSNARRMPQPESQQPATHARTHRHVDGEDPDAAAPHRPHARHGRLRDALACRVCVGRVCVVNDE